MSYDTEDNPDSANEPSVFLQAKAGFELFGQRLAPYSGSRVVAAQSMGVLFPLIGDEGLDQFARAGTYPGMLKDVLVVLWLCSLKNAHQSDGREWTPERALMKPREAIGAATEWAETVGLLDMQSQEFGAGARTAMAILQGIEASRFRIVDDSEEDEAPAGKSTPGRMSEASTSEQSGQSPAAMTSAPGATSRTLSASTTV